MTEIQDTELAESIANKYLAILADAKQITIADVQDDVDWIYDKIGKASPEIIIVNPKEYTKLVKTKYSGMLKDNAISFRLPIKDDRESFRSALYDHNKDIPQEPFRRYIQTLRDVDMEYYDGPAVQTWFMYSEYLKERYNLVFKGHERYTEFYNKVYAFEMYDDKMIIIKKPKIKLANFRLHSATGKSVEWDDGTGFYHLRGILYDEPLWTKIKNRTMSVQKVMELKNIEQRYTAIEFYGAERVQKELNAKLIDESPRGNKLYEFKPEGEWRSLKFLQYSCPSTSRLYMSFIPNRINKADEGMAWKFQMTEEEYSNMVIEA